MWRDAPHRTPRTAMLCAPTSTGSACTPLCAAAPTSAKCWSNFAATSPARLCRPRCVRIFSMTGRSRITAMIFNSPPQFGQCSVVESIRRPDERTPTRLPHTGRSPMPEVGPTAGSHERQVSGQPNWMSAVRRRDRTPDRRWTTRNGSSDRTSTAREPTVGTARSPTNQFEQAPTDR